ncbi:MAG: hypothetical protein WCR50_01440 [Proteiniphilum sp.]|jgi:hypothetical protein|nr:hypothetical protein [Proteiniphilum sp.]NCB24893.1 hypothetical protein [Bacteroidia bacterium]MDD2937253.1 hypothetical protein [Proteiniphilum sp.]MDD3076844.1 hypothetical protein [Proteiniphilum sp.]MDD3779462.1 hypothetical protein [Proteiniphilum sp.]
MKRISYAVIAFMLVLVGCDQLGDPLISDSNYLSFEGKKTSIPAATSFRSGNNFVFQLYTEEDKSANDFFMELSIPDTLTDTIFTIPMAQGEWAVKGSVNGMTFSGNQLGRTGFQSANAQIKILDGAGTCDLKISLALSDNRCVTGFYKGIILDF